MPFLSFQFYVWPNGKISWTLRLLMCWICLDRKRKCESPKVPRGFDPSGIKRKEMQSPEKNSIHIDTHYIYVQGLSTRSREKKTVKKTISSSNVFVYLCMEKGRSNVMGMLLLYSIIVKASSLRYYQTTCIFFFSFFPQL